MKLLVVFTLVILSCFSQAKVQVLFHPRDPTLEKIGEWLSEARSRVDIAMYSLDTSDQSAVIRVLKSDKIQTRLASKDLKIRCIYEGYGTPAENAEKMSALEKLGIDVRFLGKGVKVHHKFAVIDAGLERTRVITGSANWSLSSYRNYDENILFFEDEPEATASFQEEFNRIWKVSREFGVTLDNENPQAPNLQQDDLEVHFNSLRLLKLDRNASTLTDEIIREIAKAQHQIQIATTRIRLESVLDALKQAAERGVQISIVLSQDDYHDLWKRAKWLTDTAGIHTRVKFYNLKPANYMSYQMHNKFMLIDGKTVVTGSFNWSTSGEEGHIENLVELRDPLATEVLPDFANEFSMLWEMGRANYPSLLDGFEKIKSEGQLPRCGFSPTALDIAEIRSLLRKFPKCN